MRHPLSGKTIIFYVIVWAVIIIAHILFLKHSDHFDLLVIVLDSLVFNILTAVFILSYWYVVKFLPPQQNSFLTIVISHLLGVGLMVALIVIISGNTLSSLINEPVYTNFLQNSFFWRCVLATFYMIIVIMIYYLLQYSHSLEIKDKEEAELQNLVKNAELEMLKFQLNPHFIFNSLNSISSLTMTAPQKAQEMVIKLSEFLRSSLGNHKKEKHALEEEFNQMNLYLEIERVRFGDRLKIDQQVEDGCEQKLVPHLILQPIYENAIKYGLYEQLDDLLISTRCEMEGEMLVIYISNNYDTDNRPANGKGIGLQNIQKRLQVIYGISDLMKIIKNKSEFTVKLNIPQDV